MVHDRLLDRELVDRFKLLILPNIAARSDAQCGQLREFVARGGSLLVTHETSLYDQWGKRKENFGLADLFGVAFISRVEGPMQNSYLRLEYDRATGQAHPILAGFGETSRIINGVWRVHVEPRQPFPTPPLTLIPTYPDLPMEKVYPRQPKTDVAQVYMREVPIRSEISNSQPAARIVYFPGPIDGDAILQDGHIIDTLSGLSSTDATPS